ncbi:MAG: ABC transporter ATP-binding protein [Alphaproteobacteria bacterium]|nr:ABC transporter ATP-binding protein [Alphaproteobacteria bacterium]
MTAALVFEDVVKRYHRKAPPALDGLSFSVPQGALCGFVGPNGAGKTTAFSVMSGFLEPDAGRVDLLGEGPFDPWRFKGRVGVLPQDAELPGRHTPLELLEHLARLQGMPAEAARREVALRVEQVHLDDKRGSRIDALSHGMRRRVAVASALLGSPQLVVLDEPTAGLDPVQARSLRDLLKGLAGGHTLVVSSHNLLELEQICDWVVMVDHGRCVRYGTVADVTGQDRHASWVLGPGEVDVSALMARLPACAVRLEGRVLDVSAASDELLDRSSLVLMRWLVDAGVPVRGVRRGVSLEDRFVVDTRGGDAP